MPSENQQVLRLRLSDYMKQLWQADDGTIFETEGDCEHYEEELRKEKEVPLREKWFEQNDVEKLFDGLIPTWWSSSEIKKYLVPGLFSKKSIYEHQVDRATGFKRMEGKNEKIGFRIFRSRDNQYFNDVEEYKEHEKGLFYKLNFKQILDRERIWRSDEGRYFATEEECLLAERTADDGKIFDTPEEKKKHDEILFHEMMRIGYEEQMDQPPDEYEGDKDEDNSSDWEEYLRDNNPTDGSPEYEPSE